MSTQPGRDPGNTRRTHSKPPVVFSEIRIFSLLSGGGYKPREERSCRGRRRRRQTCRQVVYPELSTRIQSLLPCKWGCWMLSSGADVLHECFPGKYDWKNEDEEREYLHHLAWRWWWLYFFVPIAPMPRGQRIRPEEARKVVKDPAGKTKEYHR